MSLVLTQRANLLCRLGHILNGSTKSEKAKDLLQGAQELSSEDSTLKRQALLGLF